MGQKAHPISIRLGTFLNWQTEWYSKNNLISSKLVYQTYFFRSSFIYFCYKNKLFVHSLKLTYINNSLYLTLFCLPFYDYWLELRNIANKKKKLKYKLNLKKIGVIKPRFPEKDRFLNNKLLEVEDKIEQLTNENKLFKQLKNIHNKKIKVNNELKELKKSEDKDKKQKTLKNKITQLENYYAKLLQEKKQCNQSKQVKNECNQIQQKKEQLDNQFYKKKNYYNKLVNEQEKVKVKKELDQLFKLRQENKNKQCKCNQPQEVKKYCYKQQQTKKTLDQHKNQYKQIDVKNNPHQFDRTQLLQKTNESNQVDNEYKELLKILNKNKEKLQHFDFYNKEFKNNRKQLEELTNQKLKKSKQFNLLKNKSVKKLQLLKKKIYSFNKLNLNDETFLKELSALFFTYLELKTIYFFQKQEDYRISFNHFNLKNLSLSLSNFTSLSNVTLRMCDLSKFIKLSKKIINTPRHLLTFLPIETNQWSYYFKIMNYKSPSSLLICFFLKHILEKIRLKKKHRFCLNIFKQFLKENKRLLKQFKGLKIHVKGRLNGRNRTTTYKYQSGLLPLQNFSQKFDYCFWPAFTIYGVFGIKVWIAHRVHYH